MDAFNYLYWLIIEIMCDHGVYIIIICIPHEISIISCIVVFKLSLLSWLKHTLRFFDQRYL